MLFRFSLVLGLGLSPLFSFAQSEILGLWLDEDESAHIEIYQEGDKYFGKIVWLVDPTRPDGSIPLDDNNPDEALRSRPILDLVILHDFTYARNQWKGGTIYDPKSGKTYSSKMWLDGPDQLKLRGYWGPFYRTAVLTRVID